MIPHVNDDSFLLIPHMDFLHYEYDYNVDKYSYYHKNNINNNIYAQYLLIHKQCVSTNVGIIISPIYSLFQFYDIYKIEI